MRCTLQLHPQLLMMESKPSTSISTSTTSKPDPNLQPQNTASGKRKPNANPTSSTPTPAPASVVQKYVIDAADMISSSPDTRKLFLTEITIMCLDRAKKDMEAGIISTQVQRPPINLP